MFYSERQKRKKLGRTAIMGKYFRSKTTAVRQRTGRCSWVLSTLAPPKVVSGRRRKGKEGFRPSGASWLKNGRVTERGAIGGFVKSRIKNKHQMGPGGRTKASGQAEGTGINVGRRGGGNEGELKEKRET